MGLDKSVFGKITTWERHKSASNWHFDTKQDPNEQAYFPMCTFSGDWQSGIDLAAEESTENLAKVDPKRVSEGAASHEELDLLITTGKDYISLLYWKELYCVNDFDDQGNIISESIDTNPVYAPFLKMVKEIGMYEPHTIRVTFQRMGQMSPWHVDLQPQYFKEGSTWNKRYQQVAGEDHLRLRRVFIALTPYDYGQIWQFGNTFWKDYSAGECITFDWKNMPHATATNGFVPRINLQATGFVNENFDRLVANGSKNHIINVD